MHKSGKTGGKSTKEEKLAALRFELDCIANQMTNLEELYAKRSDQYQELAKQIETQKSYKE